MSCFVKKNFYNTVFEVVFTGWLKILQAGCGFVLFNLNKFFTFFRVPFNGNVELVIGECFELEKLILYISTHF